MERNARLDLLSTEMKILGNGCASSAVSSVLGMRVPVGHTRRFGRWKVWHFAGFDESLACGLRSANGGEGRQMEETLEIQASKQYSGRK